MRAELTNQRSLSLSSSTGTTSMRPAVVQGPAGPNTVPTDAAIATNLNDDASASAVAADARIVAEPASRDSDVPTGTKALTVVGSSAPFIKGMNIPITAWNLDWDEAWVHQQIDRAAQLGMNSVRIIGTPDAYDPLPALYKTNLHATFEYVRAKGMKIIYAFMSGSWVAEPLNLDDADIPAYEAMVVDLMDGYEGDPLILAWDCGNELDGRTSWVLDIISAVAAQIRSVDPAALVTSSVVFYMDSNTQAVRAAIAACDSHVDFHDVHIYQEVGRDTLPDTLPKALATATDKPILFGEIGGNRSASGTGNAPWVGGQRGQEFQQTAFRRYAAFANVIGFMWWKSGDAPGNVTKMGMWDENGDPVRQLGVVASFPAIRLDVARDLVEQRNHPILVNSFYRAANAASIGTPDIGSGAVAASSGSTFGTNGTTGAYVVTKSGADDWVGYDCVSFRARFDTEWIVANPTALDVGIIFRASLATNNPRRLFRLYYDAGVTGYRASIVRVDSPLTGTTNGSPTITTAGTSTNVFDAEMVGATITGTGIPGGTTITAVASATSATISANATATGSINPIMTRIYATSAVIPDLHTAGTPQTICLAADLTGIMPIFSVDGIWHWAPIPITDTGTLMANNGRMGPRWGNPDSGTVLRYMQGSVPGRRFA